MPEGDSIRRVADRLRPHLLGRTLVDVRTRGDVRLESLVGAAVAGIETHGKHMLVRPAEGPLLRVHLGMYGKWRRFPPGARWRRSRASATLILETEADVFACFKGHLEVLRGPLPERAASLVQLGPDLLADAVDYARILARAQALPEREVGELLMDQRVAAGIGNVYKSEVLFLRGTAPRTRVRDLSREDLQAIYELAAQLMQANLGPGWRTTRGVLAGERRARPGEARTYVYRRAGQRCFRCEATVRMFRQGDQARSTYWCATCQPER